MSWVLEHSEEKLGRRLVLLVLADRAHEDGGGAWPSVENIAAAARLSKRQTHSCLRALEESGAIEREGKSHTGTTIYRVIMESRGGAEFAPSEDRGCDFVQEGVQSTASGSAETAPEPSLEPSLEPSTTGGLQIREPHLALPTMVNRVKVGPKEGWLAREVLWQWNEQTGQRLASQDWLAKIIMRIREHPELTLPDHAHIIRHTLADPWWKGVASPSVIYGNGAQFEKSLTEASNPETAANQSSAEIALRLAARLREVGR